MRELKRELERYRHPSTGERFRVYSDWEDISAIGDRVKVAIRNGLALSTALLVICSRDASTNEWVSYELETFPEVMPEGRCIGAAFDLTPGAAFPQLFGADDMGANLTVEAGMTPGEWRRKVREEAPKIVHAVWPDVELADLVDRFRTDARRRRRATAALLGLLVCAIVAVCALGYRSYVDGRMRRAQELHAQALARDDGEQTEMLLDLAAAMQEAPTADPRLPVYEAHAFQTLLGEPIVLADLPAAPGGEYEFDRWGHELLARTTSGELWLWDLRGWREGEIRQFDVPASVAARVAGADRMRWEAAMRQVLLFTWKEEDEVASTSLELVDLESGQVLSRAVAPRGPADLFRVGGGGRLYHLDGEKRDRLRLLGRAEDTAVEISSRLGAGTLAVRPRADADLVAAIEADPPEGEKAGIQLWLVPATGGAELVRTLRPEGDPLALGWSADGRHFVAIEGREQGVRRLAVWEVEPWQLVGEALSSPVEESPLSAVSGSRKVGAVLDVSPGGRWVVHREYEAGGISFWRSDLGVGVWSLDEKRHRSVRLEDADRISSGRISAQGRVWITSQEANRVVGWDEAPAGIELALPLETPSTRALCAVEDAVLAVLPGDRLVAWRWPVEVGDVRQLDVPDTKLVRAIFVDRARQMLLLGEAGTLRAVDAETLEPAWEVQLGNREKIAGAWLTPSTSGEVFAAGWLSAPEQGKPRDWWIEVRRTRDGSLSVEKPLRVTGAVVDLHVSDGADRCIVLRSKGDGACLREAFELASDWQRLESVELPAGGTLFGLSAEGQATITYTGQEGLQRWTSWNDGLVAETRGHRALSTDLGIWQAAVTRSSAGYSTARGGGRPVARPDRSPRQKWWYVFAARAGLAARIEERGALVEWGGHGLVTLIADGDEISPPIRLPGRVMCAGFTASADELRLVTIDGQLLRHPVLPAGRGRHPWLVKAALQMAAAASPSVSQPRGSGTLRGSALELRKTVEAAADSDRAARQLLQRWIPLR